MVVVVDGEDEGNVNAVDGVVEAIVCCVANWAGVLRIHFHHLNAHSAHEIVGQGCSVLDADDWVDSA